MLEAVSAVVISELEGEEFSQAYKQSVKSDEGKRAMMNQQILSKLRMFHKEVMLIGEATALQERSFSKLF